MCDNSDQTFSFFIYFTVSGQFLNCEGSGLYALQSSCKFHLLLITHPIFLDWLLNVTYMYVGCGFAYAEVYNRLKNRV